MAGIADTTTTSANAPLKDKIRSVQNAKSKLEKRRNGYLKILDKHGA